MDHAARQPFITLASSAVAPLRRLNTETTIPRPTTTSAAATTSTKKTIATPPMSLSIRRERHECDVRGVQHQLHAHEHDEDVATDQKTDRSDGEEDRRESQVPRSGNAHERGLLLHDTRVLHFDLVVLEWALRFGSVGDQFHYFLGGFGFSVTVPGFLDLVVVMAITALLIIGQAAARTLLTATQDNGTLAALGMTRRQLFTASMTETAAATVAGALGAVVIAIAVSPLTPIGPARLAEPDPGISVNAGVLAAGAAAPNRGNRPTRTSRSSRVLPLSTPFPRLAPTAPPS